MQQDLFADGGADLGRVLIGHQDEQTDVAPIRKPPKRGTFVGVDRIGLEILAPDERRADHVAALVREGFTDHVCLSQDHIRGPTAPRSSSGAAGVSRRGDDRQEIEWQVWKRPYTDILTDFVPRLLERAIVTDADVETIFVDNPRSVARRRLTRQGFWMARNGHPPPVANVSVRVGAESVLGDRKHRAAIVGARRGARARWRRPNRPGALALPVLKSSSAWGTRDRAARERVPVIVGVVAIFPIGILTDRVVPRHHPRGLHRHLVPGHGRRRGGDVVVVLSPRASASVS